MMVLIVVTVALIIVVVMMVLILIVMMTTYWAGIVGHLLQFIVHRTAMLHCRQNHSTIQLVPRSCNDGCLRIFLPNQMESKLQFFGRNTIGTTKHDATRMSDLIIVKLAEIFGVNFALGSVNNGCKAIQLYIIGFHLLCGTNHIAEFTDAGRLDQNTVGSKLLQHL